MSCGTTTRSLDPGEEFQTPTASTFVPLCRAGKPCGEMSLNSKTGVIQLLDSWLNGAEFQDNGPAGMLGER